MLEDHELFDDEFMNDMLLNPKAYDIPDSLDDGNIENDKIDNGIEESEDFNGRF